MPLCLLQPFAHLRGEPRHFPAALMADFPFRGQREPLWTPHKQHRFSFLLQGNELLAGGGLRDSIPFCRLGKASGFDQITEHHRGFDSHNATGI